MSESREVTSFGAGSDALKALRTFGQAITQMDGKPFMNFTKSGEWRYGPENILAGPDEQWAIDPSSLKRGWIGWSGGQVKGERMVSFMEPLPPEDELPEIPVIKQGDGWKEQVTFDMQRIGDATEVMFKTTSKGGLGAVGSLVDRLVTHLTQDPTTPFPVVQLKGGGYKHPTYGHIHTPEFEIVQWVDQSAKPAEERKQLV